MASNETIKDDLSFLRNLAQAGQDAPLAMGPYLIAGGGWFGLASLVIGLIELGMIPANASLMAMSGLGGLLGFAVTLFLLLRRDRGQVQNLVNDTLGATWSAMGWGIFIFFVAVYLAAVRTGEETLFNSISLVVLTLYAVAWKISASVSRQTWMNIIVALTALSLLIVSLSVGSSYLWLAYAAALFLSGVAPGLYLVHLNKQRNRA